MASGLALGLLLLLLSSLWSCSGLLQYLYLQHLLWIGSFCFLSSTSSAMSYNHKPVVHVPKLILRQVSLAYTVLFESTIGLAAYILKWGHFHKNLDV